jgi:hypothetical protein
MIRSWLELAGFVKKLGEHPPGARILHLTVVVPDPDAYPRRPLIVRNGRNVTLPVLGKLE